MFINVLSTTTCFNLSAVCGVINRCTVMEPSGDFAAAVLDEIALEGLEGEVISILIRSMRTNKWQVTKFLIF